LTREFQKTTRNQKALSASVALVAMLLTVTITSSMQRSAVADTGDSDVQFVANAEMIKGHMAKAVANKEDNETSLAKAHATHPVAEHYQVLQATIEAHDAQLNSQLKTSLEGLGGKVDTMTVSDFKAETEKISAMLDQAVSKVIPQTEAKDVQFNAKVMIALLKQLSQEYEEGVQNGKVVAMVEYQDAQAFRVRADTIFNLTGSELTPHEKDNAAGFFADLKSSMNNLEDISKIEGETIGIINEVREGAGLPAEDAQTGSEITTAQYIQNVKRLLQQVSKEYRNGNFTGADSLATTAYLDNFEYVEIDLVRHNATDLKEETEQMLRVQLREMIKDRVAADQLDAQINAIDSKLDQAITVVPEFPLGMTGAAMASVIAAIVSVSRFKTTKLPNL